MSCITKKCKRLRVPRRRVPRWAAYGQLADELRETAILALPMVLTQFGQLAMTTTDLAFIGRMGPDPLAAAALAGRVYLVSFTFGAGLLAPIGPLAAQAFGAGNLGLVRRSLRVGLWAALLLSFPIIAFALQGERMLLALGQTPDIARGAQQYLSGLALGVAPALCFQALRSFMGAVDRPESVLWITVTAIPVNALLVYLLVYGNLGLPRLELVGAGLATAIVNCGIFLTGLWFAIKRRPFCEYHALASVWLFDWPFMRQLLVIGTPISMASLFGNGAIAAAALLAGMIGTSALAAHQIALQVATTLFLIAFGISMACALRVARAVGRLDRPGVKRAGLAALLLGTVVAAMITLAVIAARFAIAELFLGETARNSDATIALAAKLISVGACFFITDSVATIAAGRLRGLNDTGVPLLYAGISYWPIGFSLSYVLGSNTSLGVIGIWIGLSTGTAIYAALLVLRFELLVNRLALQDRFGERKQRLRQKSL
ncbi:MATE family efflux transporter [Bradyrhizobium canariense]|uniref:MATE family efflux transporter n=1 Tax=Bradyrhizobium canariense TaxID=255045 RepID=UPI000A18DCB6|nr:MATE family efflux transporter [Bradyrhizobium canariense]OSI75599.1 MATE family efflux transporter [Bradyrhizobium canariense]